MKECSSNTQDEANDDLPQIKELVSDLIAQIEMKLNDNLNVNIDEQYLLNPVDYMMIDDASDEKNRQLLYMDLDYLKKFIEIDYYFVEEDDDDDDDCSYFNSNNNNTDSDENSSISEDYLIVKMKCDSCQAKNSMFWRRVARTKYVCNNCFFDKSYLIAFEESNNDRICKKSSRTTNNFDEIDNDDDKLKSNSNKNKSHSNKTSQNNEGTSSRSTRNNPVSTNNSNKIFPIKASNSCNSLEEESSSSISNESTSTNTTTGQLRKSSRTSTKKLNEIKSEPSNDSENINQIENATVEVKPEMNRRTKKFKLETSAPSKFETLISKVTTSDYVFHRGFYMQIGDIVALFDKEDTETIYFAKIRAFLSDQCGQKSAVITWLIPNNNNYKQIRYAKDFDPSLFSIGPSEDFPRSLDCMEFVCRLLDNDDRLQPRHFNNNDDAYFDRAYKYESDLFRQKCFLKDIAESKFRIITKRTYVADNAANPIDEHQIIN